jgi:hypothetical protein
MVQSHFYSLWGYLCLESDRLLQTRDFAERYAALLGDVAQVLQRPDQAEPEESAPEQVVYRKAVLDYASNTRGASTDLTPRRKRHIALLTALGGPEVATHEDR